MTFLPIVDRELRVAARRRGTFWIRTSMGLVAIGLGTFLYLANIDSPPQTLARRIFLGLTVLSMFFSLFAGRRLTADCLSEEKRQGTLGLLFLTDLKGYDIVLGKLAATSLTGFYCLLAAMPVLAIPLLLGGLTNGQFWRVVLVLANTFLFSLSVGIFVSALSRDARRAAGANLLVLLLITGIPGACAIAVPYFVPGHSFTQHFLLSCPFYSLYLSEDSVFGLSRTYYWISVGLIHCLTWLFLALASWTVRHAWQDRPAGTRRFSWQEFRRVLQFGPINKRAQYRKRLLNTNAFYWLAARARLKPLLVWVVMIFVATWWIWARIKFGSLWLDEVTSGTNFATAVMLNVALKLWIGVEAGRQLAEERQGGTFELLLSTPLGVRDILRGQWLALKRLFLVPTILGACAVVFFMFSAMHHWPPDRNALAGAWLGGLIMFAADAAALFWTAMYCALTANSPNQAAVACITRVVIAPAVLFSAIIVLGNLYSYFSATPPPRPSFYLVWWFGLGFVTDLVYGLGSRSRLLTNFRQLACYERGPKR